MRPPISWPRGPWSSPNRQRKRVKDRIEITVYLSSQLGDEKTQIQSVQMGALDFLRANSNITAEFGADKSNVLALPYIFRNRDHMWNVLQGPVGKEILENFKEKNTRMLGIAYFDEGPCHFITRSKQIKTVEDLKGLKIRVGQTAIIDGYHPRTGAFLDGGILCRALQRLAGWRG